MCLGLTPGSCAARSISLVLATLAPGCPRICGAWTNWADYETEMERKGAWIKPTMKQRKRKLRYATVKNQDFVYCLRVAHLCNAIVEPATERARLSKLAPEAPSVCSEDPLAAYARSMMIVGCHSMNVNRR
jgi:hypothetical protein